MKLNLVKKYFMFFTIITSLVAIPVACSSDDGGTEPPVVVDPIADPTNANSTIEASSPVVADGTATSTVTVTIADTTGKPFTKSAGTVALSATGSAVLSAVTDNADGSYSATVTDTVAETVTVSGTLNDAALTNTADIVFEAPVQVADPTNANTTIVASAPVSVADILRSTVTVQLATAMGDTLTASGGTVALSVTGAAFLTDVADNADGTYTASVSNTVEEDVTVSGTLDGTAITDTAVITFAAVEAPNPAFEAEQSTEPLGPSLLRINSGGGEVTVASGVFLADQYFTGPSEPYINTLLTEIANTEDDAIYFSERVTTNADNFGPFSYEIPVTAGTFTVKLYFAEIFWGVDNPQNISGDVGSRIFDISMEGMPIFTDYDLYKDVGSITADEKMYDIEVTDGVLNITFEASVDKPKISAIEIFSADGTIVVTP